jgi:hypothetical protein
VPQVIARTWRGWAGKATFFTSMAEVRAFAGDDPKRAVVEEVARRALNRWDERVTHDEVAVDL